MFPSARGSLTIVGFFATLVLYLVRINMSIAIVCMTIDEVETEVNATNTTSEPLGLTHARWSDKYMWTYDRKSWSDRAHAYSFAADEEVCPGEAEEDEQYEEVPQLSKSSLINIHFLFL